MTEPNASAANAPGIVHHAGARRFTAQVDGGLAHADYELEGDAIVFTHTVVPPESEGRGVGSALARAGLDYAKREGLRVVPECPFIAAYVAKHPGAAG